MKPFSAHQPKIILPSHIGNGVGFLNRTLSSKLFAPAQNAEGTQLLLDFLRGFKYNGESLLLSQRVSSVAKLRNLLVRADKLLERYEDDDLIVKVAGFDEMGLLRGWGKDVARVRESFQVRCSIIPQMMIIFIEEGYALKENLLINGNLRVHLQLLLDIIQAPDADTLERFLSRLPLVFKVAILSPHGYFGQTGVLGLPDTGGQVSNHNNNSSGAKRHQAAASHHLLQHQHNEIPGQVRRFSNLTHFYLVHNHVLMLLLCMFVYMCRLCTSWIK